MPADLVNFWRRFKPSEPPNAHPDDLEILRSSGSKHVLADPMGFGDFVSSPSFGDFQHHRLHLSLLPVPYGGNLARADIVILLLNPGLGYTDYWGETRVPTYRSRIVDNLRQSLEGAEFPFIWLDPELCWHGGFAWWETKLRAVTAKIAVERFNGRYLDALRDLSSRLACVELVPYHSPSFRSHGLIDRLPSVAAARRFVRGTLVPAANRSEKLVIVTRGWKHWGRPEPSENAVIYERGETRGASLGPETKGGRAILWRYGISTG